MFASAKLEMAPVNSTVVPGNALRTDGKSSSVFVVENGRIVEKLVELGILLPKEGNSDAKEQEK